MVCLIDYKLGKTEEIIKAEIALYATLDACIAAQKEFFKELLSIKPPNSPDMNPIFKRASRTLALMHRIVDCHSLKKISRLELLSQSMNQTLDNLCEAYESHSRVQTDGAPTNDQQTTSPLES